MNHKIFRSSDKNVTKLVFEKESEKGLKPIAVEAVLYRYPTFRERTVICCSVQSGCPVGCTFCGTGKFFQRNLTAGEIVHQVLVALQYADCPSREIKKLQIMFMSMGEPFLNYKNLEKAIELLHGLYSNAQLLVSTSAPENIWNNLDNFIQLSKRIPKVGIQFSVHESNNTARKRLIPTPTLSLEAIGVVGEQWAKEVGRKPFFNYCAHSLNSSWNNINELRENFNPDVWECTLSVICEKDQSMKSAIESQLDLIQEFQKKMTDAGYSIRVFNPAGQDDIGGGCGQLWYFQEWINKQKTNK